MRPDILNPLFAEVESLKGVGPTLAKPLKRLKLERVIDVLFHLPVGSIDRKPVETIDAQDVGRIVTVRVVPTGHRSSAGRGPFRVEATDRDGNILRILFFGGHPGWGKKLLPLGEPRIVSGKLDRYGDELQMVHPDHVLPPEEAGDLPEREPVYPLSEGLTTRRMGQLAEQALLRAPDLPEWIEPSLKAARGWPDWHEAMLRAHADPQDALARARLAYDEVFANQLALMLVRAAGRKRRGCR
jgi:ATP-dependent DNA helicase RecG